MCVQPVTISTASVIKLIKDCNVKKLFVSVHVQKLSTKSALKMSLNLLSVQILDVHLWHTDSVCIDSSYTDEKYSEAGHCVKCRFYLAISCLCK